MPKRKWRATQGQVYYQRKLKASFARTGPLTIVSRDSAAASLAVKRCAMTRVMAGNRIASSVSLLRMASLEQFRNSQALVAECGWPVDLLCEVGFYHTMALFGGWL